MTRFSPGSVRTTVGGWIFHYRELELAERVVFVAWSAAVVATLLGLAGVSTYQAVASQPQRERCTVTMVSAIFTSVTGTHYRVVDTSCGRYEINPGDRATGALRPLAPDSIALTGAPESGLPYILTFRGFGDDRTLVAAMSH